MIELSGFGGMKGYEKVSPSLCNEGTFLMCRKVDKDTC